MGMKHAAVVAGMALGLMSGSAKAAYIIDIYQNSSDVLAYGSGSFNTHDLQNHGSGNSYGASVIASTAEINFGISDYTEYTFVNGPSSFGPGSEHDTFNTQSIQGQAVGVSGRYNFILIPAGYVSNSLLMPSTADFGAGTLSSFGINPGTYVYSWGTGANADTLTVNVGVTPILSTVPLPASAPMFGAALLALGAVGYGVKRRKAATAA